MKWQIALGAFATVALVGMLGFVAAGEQARMASFTAAYQARQIEAGAQLFEDNCRSCHGPQGKGIESVAPAINAADLFNGQRLQAISFPGTVEDYVRASIAAGRPKPSAGTNYPQRMPTWAQRNGGPLRDDQIDSLVAYIMNWKDRALAEAGGPTPGPSGPTFGTDITAALPAGDPSRGKTLAEGPLGCANCHLLAPVGPAWLAQPGQSGIGARAETRIKQPDYTGKATDATRYLLESIVQSNAYVVQGFQPNIMPQNFGQRMSAQDVADVIAYLLTLR